MVYLSCLIYHTRLRMSEPIYDEDVVNLGYLKKQMDVTDENIKNATQGISKHYGTQPMPPYNAGDTWNDGTTLYTCIHSRIVGNYVEADWTTESGALDMATKKSKTYLKQPTNYQMGDSWLLQSDTDHPLGKKGELLYANKNGNDYVEDDWGKELTYVTHEEKLEIDEKIETAINNIASLQTTSTAITARVQETEVKLNNTYTKEEIEAMNGELEEDLDIVSQRVGTIEATSTNVTAKVESIENSMILTHTTEEAYQHTLENSADNYCKDVELYGESIQNGEPTPNTPAEILSPGKNIEIKSVGSDSEQNITTIQLPDKLRSTPSDYPAERIRDRIHKENGKWYYEKRMKNIICDGSEDWQIWAFGSSVVERFYLIVDEPSLNSYAFSNMLPYMSGNEEQSHIRMGGTNWGDITLYLSLSIASTVEELKTWLASNNLEVQYPLAEPIITEITDEDTIYALEHIKTYAGSTEITSDVLLKLEYYTNTAFNKEYETKQNATKQYNTTIEKFAQQEITNESIQQEVSETKTTIQNDYQTKEEASTQYTQLSQKFEFDVNAAISDLKDNGVPKVVSSIITIDENGLTSGRSDSEYYNVMNNTGNYQYNAGQLLAKYDKDGAEIPRLKSDIGVIAGVKHVKETINGVVHHRTYAID